MMIRLSPTVLYGIIAMLIICLLLGAVTLPNASRWFQGAHASIQQDLIVLLGNATSLKSDVASGHNEWQYNQNLVAVDNTPMPSDSGLQGILYDRGLSCSSIVNNTIPSLLQESIWKVNLARIALIQLGGCRLLEKLEFAQNDGASAVIFYDNASFVTPISDETLEGMRITPNKIFIPAYHVDGKTGKELYERLANLTQWETRSDDNDNNSNNTIKNVDMGDTPLPASHLVTRVTMYPDQKPFLEPWQFAMIVIGVVIITSIVIVVAVQCHLCHLGRKRRRDQRRRQQQRRRQRRQQHMSGGYGVSYFIDGGNDDDEEDDDDIDNMAQESFWLQLISTARTEDDYHSNQDHEQTDHHQQNTRQEKKKRYRLHPSVLDSIPTREWNDIKTDVDQCVICLESFSPGDTLRILPCEHEYHCHCIDVWLTKKNACCPLCLQLAVTLPSIPEPVYIRDHQQDAVDTTRHLPEQHDERRTHTELDFTTNQQATIVQRQHTSSDSSLRHTWFVSQTTSTSSLSSLSTTTMHDAYN